MSLTSLEQWRHRSRGPRSYLRAADGRLTNFWYDSRDTVSKLLSGAAEPSTTAYVPDAEEMCRIRALLAQILTENIIPFWYPAVLDLDYGGYGLSVDRYGRWKGPARKGTVSQARTLWFFSRLAQSPYGQSDHLQAAAHGYSFLRDHLWDSEYGGFHWETDATGMEITAPHKHLFAQVAALYALTEYARASHDDEAISLSRDLFGTLETRAHDRQYGGYQEFFARDWSRPPDTIPNYLGTAIAPDAKTANTHMHLMESITSYLALTGDPIARDRLLELLTINNNSVVRNAKGATSAVYRRDWTPLRRGTYDEVLFGYQLKNIWLSMETCKTIGVPIAPLLDLYRTLFTYAIRNGFDRKHGGFYESGPIGWPATRRNKVWWVQAEALLCALNLYSFTREEVYFNYFRRTLDWIEQGQVDWEHGEWFARAQHQKGWGDKADRWKDPYHNGRAMIVGLDLLDGLEQHQESPLVPAAAPHL
jgi:cellobiose epimerase